ncbi:MAG: hypothetical protein CMG54_01905 [Candidatus Marinimicrobia bacterium]|nr:hypothetical protein [Candidatus Neomarinimicrobiota bacterium]|tara:strand:- start:5021 stop:5917 length:897 start_codon:yes stop_codon:yes gene_type:complete
MKNYILKLGNLDRRIIFLLIGLSVLIPLINPNLVDLPLGQDRNTKIVYDSISELNDGDRVLISFAYGASTKPEVHPMAVGLLNHLFTKGIKVYIVSLWPESPIMAEQAISAVKESQLFDIKDGIDFVMFDYKVGGFVVIKGIADNFRDIYQQDKNGISINDLPIMEGIYDVKDFDFVFDFSAGVPGNAEWVQYACDPKKVPLSSGCTSIMVTDAIPYVESGQLKGILAGMPGAAEYEKMVYDFMVKEQNNNNKYINSEKDIIKGKAYARMSAQSIAHLLMVLFIIIGNIAYYFSRKEN